MANKLPEDTRVYIDGKWGTIRDSMSVQYFVEFDDQSTAFYFHSEISKSNLKSKS